MKKGVVVESNGKWTVVLTPEGEFIKIPSQSHHLEGKEISFRGSTVALERKKKTWNPPLMRGVALAAACLLFLVLIFPSFGGSQAYAAVTFDINPSLELEVDDQAEVIKAIAFNEEAKELLDHVEWKGRTLSTVALDIIEEAKELGYMNKQRQVLITTTYYDEVDDEKENITQMLEVATAQADEELTVVIVEGKKEWHEEAKEKHVSPGAYMLTKQVEKQGIELKEQDWKATPLDEMPPVKGVTIVHPQGKKVENGKGSFHNQDKNKGKDGNPKKQETIKQDEKSKTTDLEKKNGKEIKKDHNPKDEPKQGDDQKQGDDRQHGNKQFNQDQKQSFFKKGPIGPPYHVEKDKSQLRGKSHDNNSHADTSSDNSRDNQSNDEKNKKEKD